MPIHAKVSGVWKQATALHVKVSGAWKACTAAYVKVSGVWKQVLTLVAISAQNVFGTTAAGYQLNADGSAYTGVNGSYSAVSGEWLVAGAVGDFEARATLDSGTTPSGTLGSWLPLSTTRTWELTAGPGQVFSCTLTVEIRRASDSVVLDTASVSLDADNV